MINVKRGTSVDSPAKVQFENGGAVVENQQQPEVRSSCTSPLLTESITDDESSRGSDDNERPNKRLPKYYLEEVQEQYGYDPRRLNRIKFRREEELVEHNYGINLSLVKTDKAEMQHLRKYLVKWQLELNKFVDEGTAPVFGYPPICYSPPSDPSIDGNRIQKAGYLRTLMRHIFRKNTSLASVAQIIDAKE